jgi:glycosyltransferase involved in cell wall biosynthesis
MKLLTVCIPTINRLGLLAQLLDGLLPQAAALGVDIFVCDNASTDGTGDYLRGVAANNCFLSYKVNEKTVPIDANMFSVMSGRSSTYIYPLGDDDFISDGALAKIVDELKFSPDLLVLNSRITDIDFNILDGGLPGELHGLTYEDSRDGFANLWNRLQFGSFVVRNEIREEWFREYFGTSHAYAGAVWELMCWKFEHNGCCSIRCMHNETVLLRNVGKTWKKDSAEIFLYGIPKWLDALPRFYVSVVAPLQKKYFNDNAKLEVLLKFRKHRQLCLHNHARLLSYFPSEYQRKAYLVCLIPAPIAKLLSSCIKKYRKLVAGAKYPEP